MAALNFSAMIWPNIPRTYYMILVVAAIVINVAVAGIVLNRIEPATGEDEVPTASAIKCFRWLTCAFVALPLMLGLAGWLNSQFAPFYICGIAFLVIATKVPAISVDKRLDELRRQNGDGS